MSKKIILSGARPTGDIHLGNYFGALENWVRLQDNYDCHFFIADWHALTTGYADTAGLPEHTVSLMADFMACGLDPERSVLFLQSQVMEHAELFLLFSMLTPLPWLERCPTYKDQLNQLKDKDIATYGFLGYPCLQAADILAYKADFVPVGEDQLPHLELTREIARRFNFLYGQVFPEPQPLLTQSRVLPGTDGRKMSKSYNNTISFADPPDVVRKKVMSMVTDPARIRKNDPGHPEVCSVYAFHKVFSPDEVDDIGDQCRAGTIGCVACKKKLQERLLAFHEPIHNKRTRLLQDKSGLKALIAEGSAKARTKAAATLAETRRAMNLGT
ncbi:MAG: tryptophan--tRNA ligase [Eubacteriales bacterium]|nr:tryptophan--tRNA ligase [Clostridiales bacterium]MDD4140996.1 tryptophan--tRNA ligase [Eubacteriales bacterium]MDD4744263.1 tryptophan--tRNA ligase [Eubacteriales bacterium]